MACDCYGCTFGVKFRPGCRCYACVDHEEESAQGSSPTWYERTWLGSSWDLTDNKGEGGSMNDIKSPRVNSDDTPGAIPKDTLPNDNQTFPVQMSGLAIRKLAKAGGAETERKLRQMAPGAFPVPSLVTPRPGSINTQDGALLVWGASPQVYVVSVWLSAEVDWEMVEYNGHKALIARTKP
jgi:hypothetical protein